MIQRKLVTAIQERMFQGKVILLMGPRQVGKTTILQMLFPNSDDVLWLNGDELATHRQLQEPSAERFRLLLGNKRVLVIDEAQRIDDIGLKLKILVDGLRDVQIIATGSSSFELANLMNEPLTGRKWEFRLFPLSYSELCDHLGVWEEHQLLQHRLVYGYYPEIINNPGDEIPRLGLLADSYLYRDIFHLENILKTQKFDLLLQALAYQIGSQVSYNELAQICGLDAKTVERYIDLLEKGFVVFRLGSYSTNLRNELKKSRKIYFYDNGIRNAILGSFEPFESRTDRGALWENFLVSDRLKRNAYANFRPASYFWKNTAHKEVDYLEMSKGELHAYEFKWKGGDKVRLPLAFSRAYPDAKFSVVDRDNAMEFLL